LSLFPFASFFAYMHGAKSSEQAVRGAVANGGLTIRKRKK
jgi:hypothetical protein